jgi:hypothetical protein
MRYLAALLVVLALPVQAETLSVPGYDIHYQVFPSTFLSPEMASRYDIVRADDLAVINVAVRRPSDRAEGEPQAARVSGTRFDLVHRRPLDFVEYEEGGSIYYVATTKVLDRETIYFSLDVQPDPEMAPHRIEFEKTFNYDE